jgi:GH35 family endo-1,4-beta-xylanase
MWGMDDRNSWKSIGNPCLFDEHLNPKPAFFAAANPDSVSGL